MLRGLPELVLLFLRLSPPRNFKYTDVLLQLNDDLNVWKGILLKLLQAEIDPNKTQLQNVSKRNIIKLEPSVRYLAKTTAIYLLAIFSHKKLKIKMKFRRRIFSQEYVYLFVHFYILSY